MINTVVPFLYAYGRINAKPAYTDKALQWMEALPAEHNAITRGFEGLGVENLHAFDSQALLQLKNEYCNDKQCLHCAVGAQVLKNKS